MVTPARARIGLVFVAATLALSGCSAGESGTATPTAAPLPAIDEATLAQRGDVIDSAPIADLPSDVAAKIGEARTIVYRSVSAYDSAASEVSGTVMVPKGTPPEGGWPVLSYGHPTTGTTQDCGPSLFPDLRGLAGTLGAIVESGFVVTMTDFQGLGHPGEHPYLEPVTAAFNMIDAVRAVRTVFPDVSDRWLAFGASQGGQASWAANEYAGDYGSGLNLVGAVAVAPPADITGFADAAAADTLTPAQTVFAPLIIDGLRVVHPELVESDYIRGPAEAGKLAFSSCDPAANATQSQVAAQLDPEQVRPASDAATARLKEWLADAALPKRKASAPLYVVNGSADDLVLPAWVESAVRDACALGDTVTHRVIDGAGHGDVDGGADMYTWMVDRFAGSPAESNC